MQPTHDLLHRIVQKAACKPGWSFRLDDDDEGLRLVITVPGLNSWDSVHRLTVAHFFPVPFTTWNEASWRRWIFECCRGVENHELGEWFRIGEIRPFLPLHGPGENPYTVHEYRDPIDAMTTQDGSIRNTGPKCT